jgi:hypothetical protein
MVKIEYVKEGIIVEGTLILLEDIINKVNQIRVSENQLCLLELEWEGNRNFDGIYEIRVMTKANASKFIEEMEGYEVYFGEIAGKHSDIYGTLNKEDLNIIEDVEKEKEFLKKHPSGTDYNFSFIDMICDQLPEEAENKEDDYGNEVPMTYSQFIELFKL